MKKLHALLFLFLLAVLWSVSAFRPFSGRAFDSRRDTASPWMARIKDHKGKTVTSYGGVISFSSGLHNDYYEVDSSGKTGYLYVEAKLAAFTNPNAKQLPLNISIVIDRSGSMQGVKMGNAKKAAKAIVDQLGAEDFVSVVMYDNIVDSVQAPVHAIDKEAIKKKIDGITARSATNLWGGTEKGYEYVQKNFRTGYINRVLLISDGLANAGLTDSALITLKVQQYKDEQGITLSTFGIGLDYNETLMTNMAESGQGNYYFVDDPSQMAAIFRKEINGLMKVAAQDAEFRVRLPQGIKITKAYPLKFRQEGDEAIVTLRDLFSGETKGILLQFGIEDHISRVLKFTSTLNYTDAGDGSKKSLVNVNELAPVRTVEPYLTHFNQEVVGQVVIATANENLEKALQQVDRGEYEQARQTLRANGDYLRSSFRYTGKLDNYDKLLDSLNTYYNYIVIRAESLNADSLKKVQKMNKAANYKIRNKKQ